MKKYCCAVLALTLNIACAASPQYVHSAEESRAYIRQYCLVECENNSAKPHLPYRLTFERALLGDFGALRTIFSSPDYHTNDQHWDEIPWRILHVIGDERFAAFVLSRPPTERWSILSGLEADPGGGSITQLQALDTYFRTHFPQTWAIWRKEGPFRAEPEQKGFDYNRRHLFQALVADPRFAEVRLYRKQNITLVVAPKSSPKVDRIALKLMIEKYLGNDFELVFESRAAKER